LPVRIGLVTDVHDHVEPLARALDLFRGRGVDIVVSLGDACDAFSRRTRCGEVAALLERAGAAGVWGNHDVMLCHEVSDHVREQYPAEALRFMATIRPRLVLGGCHFSHVGPWVDPYDAGALWSFEEGPPDFAALARRPFAAVPERFVFVGHYHRWLAVTPTGPLGWQGEGPLDLSGAGRAFVVVGAVFQGHCGVFDTDSAQLCPLRC
jgi:predicted phosphodiesterase